MRTIGGAFYETSHTVIDSLKEFITVNRPAEGDFGPDRDTVSVSGQTYIGDEKADVLSIELTYDKNGKCSIQVGEDADNSIVYIENGKWEDVFSENVAIDDDSLKEIAETVFSEVSGMNGGDDVSLGRLSFVRGDGTFPANIESLPGTHTMIDDSDLLKKVYLGDLMHGIYKDPVDPKGDGYRYPSSGIISPELFEKNSGESFKDNRVIEVLKEKVPEFGTFFGYDFLKEEPAKQTITDNRDDVRMVFTVETYRENPLITQRFSVDGEEDTPVRMSVISGTPMPPEGEKKGIMYPSVDVVFHDAEGRILADFKLDDSDTNQIFASGSRLDYLNEYKDRTLPDSFSSSVEKASDQLKQVIRSDVKSKLATIVSHEPQIKDTLRDLDVRVGKIALAYDFSAREWVGNKEKASEQLSIIKGYKKDGTESTNSERIEAAKTLKELIPALSSSFDKYVEYKTELIDAAKETRQFAIYGADKTIIDPDTDNMEIDFSDGPCSNVIFPSFDLVVVPALDLPVAYDDDMERYVSRYNESAQEGEKIEYSRETHCVTHNGEVLSGAVPNVLEYEDMKKSIAPNAVSGENIFVDYEHDDDTTTNVEAVLRVIPEDCKYNEIFEDESNLIGYQFSAEDIDILQATLDIDFEKDVESNIVESLNEACFTDEEDKETGSVFKDDADETDEERSAAIDTAEDKYRQIIDSKIEEVRASVPVRDPNKPTDDLSYRLRSLENRRIGGVNLENEKDGSGIRLSKEKEADIRIDSLKDTQREYKKDGMEKSVERWEKTDISSLDRNDPYDKIKAEAAEKWKNAKSDFLKVETAYNTTKKEYEEQKEKYDKDETSIVKFRTAEANYKKEEVNYKAAKDKLEQDKIEIGVEERFAERKEGLMDELKDLWGDIAMYTKKMDDIAIHYAPILNIHKSYKWNDFMRGRAIHSYVMLGGDVGRDSVITRRVRPLEMAMTFSSWTRTSMIGTFFNEALVDFFNSVVGYDYKPKYDYATKVENVPKDPVEKPNGDNIETKSEIDSVDVHGKDKTYIDSLEKDKGKESDDIEKASRLRPDMSLRETGKDVDKNGRDTTAFKAEGRGVIIERTETKHRDGTISFSETIRERRTGNFIENVRGVIQKDGTVRYENRYIDRNNPGIMVSKFGIEKPQPDGSAIRYRILEDKQTGKVDWKNPRFIIGTVDRQGNVSEISRRVRDIGDKKTAVETTIFKMFRDGRREKVVTSAVGNDRRGNSSVEIKKQADGKESSVVITRNLDHNGNGVLKISNNGKEKGLNIESSKKGFQSWKVIGGKIDGGTYDRRVSADKKQEITYKESKLERNGNFETGRFVLKEKNEAGVSRSEGTVTKQYDEKGNLLERILEYKDETGASVVRTYNEKGDQIRVSREFNVVREGGSTEKGNFEIREKNGGTETKIEGIYEKQLDKDGNVIQTTISYDDRENQVNVIRVIDKDGNVLSEEQSPIEVKEDDGDKADSDDEKTKDDVIVSAYEDPENYNDMMENDDDNDYSNDVETDDEDDYDSSDYDEDEEEAYDGDSYDFDDVEMTVPPFVEEAVLEEEPVSNDETPVDEGLLTEGEQADADDAPGEKLEVDDNPSNADKGMEQQNKDEDIEKDAAASITGPAKKEGAESDAQRDGQDFQRPETGSDIPGMEKNDLVDMFVKGSPDEKTQNLTDFLDGLKDYFSDEMTTVKDIMDAVGQIAHSLAEIIYGLEGDAAIRTVSDVVDTVPVVPSEEALNDAVREKTGDDDFNIREQLSIDGDSYLEDLEKAGGLVDSPPTLDIEMPEENAPSDVFYKEADKAVDESIEQTVRDIEQTASDFRDDVDVKESSDALERANEMERLAREGVGTAQNSPVNDNAFHDKVDNMGDKADANDAFSNETEKTAADQIPDSADYTPEPGVDTGMDAAATEAEVEAAESGIEALATLL